MCLNGASGYVLRATLWNWKSFPSFLLEKLRLSSSNGRVLQAGKSEYLPPLI